MNTASMGESNAWWYVVLSPILIGIFFLPLAFGGTTPATVGICDALLVLSFLAWVIFLFKKNRRPRYPKVCLISIPALWVIGLSHWLNPKSFHEELPWRFVEIDRAIQWLPGTLDRLATQPVLIHLFCFSLGFLVLLDAVSERKNRLLVLKCIALSGFIIALIGIAQKAGGTTNMLWTPYDRDVTKFFAAFRYHANAASFLNLSWPAALAVWLHNQGRQTRSLESSFWLTVLFFTVIAVFVNTSKAGHLLGALGILMATVRFGPRILAGAPSKLVVALTTAFFLAVFSIALIPALSASAENWAHLFKVWGTDRGRLGAYEVCLRMVPDSGIFGNGPGTFRLAFPFYREDAGQLGGFWYYAHQDLIQVIIEWGYLGAIFWVGLIGGAVLRGLVFVKRAISKGVPESSISCSVLAITIVSIHAMVDFPMQIPSVQLLIAAYLAILWSTPVSKIREMKKQKGA